MSDLPPLWNVNWQQHAACRGCDPDIWFPARGKDVHEGKTICSHCPVVVECGNWANHYNEKRGIWGGLTWNERRRVRRGTAERDCPVCAINHVPRDPDQDLCAWCERWRPTQRPKARQ